MSETIGQQLGAARNSLELTIEDVAHKTRVHRDVLRQLEADEFDKLPNMMFVKSFLKIYSEHVNVDASGAIAKLEDADLHHGEQFLLGGISPAIRDSFGRLTSRIPVRPILASAAAIVLIGISGNYLVSHLYGSNTSTAAEPAVPAAGEGEMNDDPTGPTADVEELAGNDVEGITTPIIAPEGQRIAKTVPSLTAETEVTNLEPVDPASIPKAKAVVPKAEPVDVDVTEGDDDAEADTEGVDDVEEATVTEETYEPFEVVTPGVVANDSEE